ncbi:MAG: hypothetical protein ACI8QS_001075 [Planctomycetota bacterium]|jgi:hypothetical protein
MHPMTRSAQHPTLGLLRSDSPSRTARASLVGTLSISGLSISGLLIAGLLIGTGCAMTDHKGDQDLFAKAVQEGRFWDAEELAQAALERDAADPVAIRNMRDVEVMMHIEQARRLTFEGRPKIALDVLLAAQGIDGENPALQVWVAKTRRQLAGEWLELARSLSGDAQLSQAVSAMRQALIYVPDDAGALEDLARAERRILYRENRSEESFWSGLSALREGRLVSADRDLGISLLYNKNNADAARRRVDVAASLAAEGLLSAQILEEQELFFAASTGYRTVLLQDPANTEAQAGVDRMAREVLAERHMRLAEMMILRGEYDLARAELVVAREQTLKQQERVGQLEGEIESARWESMLARANALYQDQRHGEAVVVLDALLSEVESYSNAQQFRDSLADDIAKVEELYASAMVETDNEAKLLLLRQIQVIWVEYKDVPELIVGLSE